MFTHLRVKSEFSIEEGLLRVEDIVRLAKESGSKSVALTDFQNVGGLAKFHLLCKKEGLNPISGAEITLHDDSNGRSGRILLLAKNDRGYAQLNNVLTATHNSAVGKYGPELALAEFLALENTDLICLSGFSEGFLDNCFRDSDSFDSGDIEGVDFTAGARSLARVAAKFQGRFYVEIQKSANPISAVLSGVHEKFAKAGNLPVVATCPNLYEDASSHEAHRIRHLISTNKSQQKDWDKARVYYAHSQWSAPQEMQERFADNPRAIENTQLIASQCNHLIQAQKPDLPRFPTPSKQSESQYLACLVNEGIERRLQAAYDKDQTPELYNAELMRYQERAQYELSVIKKMGFEGYFLIVQDYIGWAKSNDIGVGPARGSGAGSLVAYALGITDVDPMVYGLLFERFLNPERISMPDIDTDFCSKRRGEVITYLREKYGDNRTTQIHTYSRFKDASVVDSVGRTYGLTEAMKTRIKKLITINGEDFFNTPLAQIPSDIKAALPGQECEKFFAMCRNLMGIVRGVGTHPAGVIISGQELNNYTGLMGSNAFDRGTMLGFEDLEVMGLVKLDLLGIKQITLLSSALMNVNARRESLGNSNRLTMDSIPLADPAVYDLLSQGSTVAIFQLEGGAPKSLSTKMKPNNLSEIAAINALIRPGPANAKMDEQYIHRRNIANETGVHDPSWYAHEKLMPVLESTFGVMIYQEQVMRIAQEMAGYTLGQADILRKVIGKKKTEDMAKQREIFVSGAVARGFDEGLSTQVFDLIEKFGDYGFNLSHSVAYSVISYQTAWMKAQYPAEYMAAALDSAISHADKKDEEAKVNVFLEDVQRNCFVLTKNGPEPIEVMAPSVNSSFAGFSPVYEDGQEQATKISFGLAAIKKIGFDLADSISNERLLGGGRFKNLDDFLQRCYSFLTKAPLEALIKAGALDEFGYSRKDLLDQSLLALDYYKKTSTKRSIIDPEPFQYQFSAQPDSFDDLAEMESDALGFFFKCDPLKSAGKQIERDFGQNISGLESKMGETVTIAGYISSIKTRKTAKKEVMADVVLKDANGAVGGTVFPRTYGELTEKSQRRPDQKLFEKGAIVKMTGKVEYNEFRDQIGLVVYGLEPYQVEDSDSFSSSLEESNQGVKALDLVVTGNKDALALAARLSKYASPDSGGEDLYKVRLLRNSSGGMAVECVFPSLIKVSPELKETLRQYFGDENFIEKGDPGSQGHRNIAMPRRYLLKHLMNDQVPADALALLPNASVQRDIDTGEYLLIQGNQVDRYEAWEDLFGKVRGETLAQFEQILGNEDNDSKKKIPGDHGI